MNIWQPTLTGKQLSLRPLRSEDFEELFQVASDPLIWEQHPEPDRYKREIFTKFFVMAMEEHFAFAVLDNATGKIIGSSRYAEDVPDKSSIEIGYTFLSREFWGKKYNWELKSLMLNHAFQYVDNVYFYVGNKNIRSQTAMQRIGGKEIGTARKRCLDVTEHDSIIYLIDKNHWQQFSQGVS